MRTPYDKSQELALVEKDYFPGVMFASVQSE
jgi:hypothetical protein